MAVEQAADPALPPIGVEHPGGDAKRRPMTHVAPMAAVELGHPLALLVLVEPDDSPLHSRGA